MPGNLIVSISPAPGMDGFGNKYKDGVTIYNGTADLQLHVNSTFDAPAIEMPTGVTTEAEHGAMYSLPANTGLPNEAVVTWLIGPGSSLDNTQAAIVLVSANHDGSGEAYGGLYYNTPSAETRIAYWDGSGIHMGAGMFVTADTWHGMPAFNTGYSHGSPAPSYKIYPDGTVSFAGVCSVAASTSSNNMVAAFGSSAYCPVSIKKFLCPTSVPGNLSVELTVNPSGELQVSGGPAGGSSAFTFNIDCVRFPLDV